MRWGRFDAERDAYPRVTTRYAREIERSKGVVRDNQY